MNSKELYDKLSSNLPKEAKQESEGNKTGKGYDTKGYGYQFIVNRFNEVLGIGGWNWDFKELERLEGAYKTGRKFYEITGATTITVFLDEGKSISHTEFGGHQSASVTDALKGASTNAFKKTAGFFGVGKQAFEKSIDLDNTDQPAVKNTGSVDYETKLKSAKSLTELQKIWASVPPAVKGELNLFKEELKTKLTK